VPRSNSAKVAQTRLDILAKAVDLASVEGLEGLTIGRLAGAISLSKTGLFAHFGSKELLQLAVVETAREIFEKHVLEGTDEADPGLQRLVLLADRWLAYLEKGLLRGGCFFAAASSEVDDRPGRVRERVASLMAGWVAELETEASTALELGQIRPEPAPDQLAFEVHAFLLEANRCFQLHGDAGAFRRAERAIGRVLDAAATADGRKILDVAR
jgi:AcrR family transcriptional regulator